MRARATIAAAALCLAALPPTSFGADEREQALFRAVRAGDLAAVKALLDQGVAVDAKSRYDRTALSFAADRGQAEMVALLLERGADVNARDTFYGVTPLFWAADHEHVAVVKALLAKGATGVGQVLGAGIQKKNAELVRIAIGTGRLDTDELASALEQAEKGGLAEVATVLRAAGAVLPPKGDLKLEEAILTRYAGTYQEPADDEQTLTVTFADGALQGSVGGPPFTLGAIDTVTFRPTTIGRYLTLTFKVEGERVRGVTVKDGSEVEWFARVEAK